MRAVLFGAAGAVAETLAEPAVRSALARLAAGRPTPDEPALQRAHALSLLRYEGDDVGLGSVVRTPPPIDPETLDRAADIAATSIRSRLADLAACTEEALPPGFGWREASLLIVGGLLLDLFVGKQLRAQGLVEHPEHYTGVWLLPNCSGLSIGMRGDYNRAAGLGACGMWIGARSAPALPDPRDVATVLRRGADEPERSLAALQLRYLGWYDGDLPRFVHLRSDAPIWHLLMEAAASIVEQAHVVLLTALPDREDADGDSILMASRLLMEDVLARLSGEGVVLAGPRAEQRVVWEGPSSLLTDAPGAA